jgi:hypothetical protein
MKTKILKMIKSQMTIKSRTTLADLDLTLTLNLALSHLPNLSLHLNPAPWADAQ